MRLRCLAGRYAGQILDYSTAVGLAALRTGMAAPLEAPAPSAPVPARGRIPARLLKDPVAAKRSARL